MGPTPSQVAEGRYKGWKRVSEVGRYWPENKYSFAKYLTKVGDWIESFPMSHDDMRKMELAAHAWAASQRKRITTARQRQPEGKYCLRVILISQHRKREYT